MIDWIDSQMMQARQRAAHYGDYTLDEAWEIARKVDSKVDQVTEFEKGWHFMRKEDEFSDSDPGFAVSRKDGRVYHGFAAHGFLYG